MASINLNNLFNTQNRSPGNDDGITITNPVTAISNGTSNTSSDNNSATGEEINSTSSGDGSEAIDIELVPEFQLDPEYVLVQEKIDVIESSFDILINVVSDTYVSIPDVRNILYPKEVRGGDFIGYDVDFNISYDTVNTTFVEIQIGESDNIITSNASNGDFTFNVKEILENYSGFETALRNGQDKIEIPFKFTPVNTSGNEPVKGREESFIVNFDKGDLNIPRSVAINRLVEGFRTQLDNADDVFDSSKYLTHLMHLGEGDNRIISNWIGADDSLIFKMYEPLPTSVQLNDKVWVSKLESEPIIETVTITGDEGSYCPPLKGANFALDVDNGIGFDIYDELVASGSQTSTELVNQYANIIGIDTEKLNITYTTGSVYAFENFTHFSSAEERIKNFYYKVQLIENYDSQLEELPTGSQSNINVSIERERTEKKKNTVIQNFDGFETFLYEESGSLAFPKSGSTLLNSTSSEATDWYNVAVNLASTFDRNNVHYLNNNLPVHITEDSNNEEFLLFMDMIGQHFDVLWVYISGMTRTKKLEAKVDKGITNDLIYHMLESFGWNTEQAYDSQFLWEYAFGKNKDGSQKYNQSLKSANHEVWRRILNNLPYLLKHKGTKRSLQAILASYGVPESLLTITEFGGPVDPTGTSQSNYTFRDTTAALNFTGDDSVTTFWREINGVDPGAIELNVKFDEASTQTIFTVGVGAPRPVELRAVQTTGSLGKVELEISTGGGSSSTIETPEVKLFDGNYKQIVINRTLDSTSVFDLYVKESVEERLRINVSASLDISNTNGWNSSNNSTVSIGNTLIGSIDEFRIWKFPLIESAIDNHAKIPDAIDGNTYTSSTEDLWFRLDFERPKNRGVDTDILNVAISNAYGEPSGSAVGFDSVTEYPYNYTTYNRTVSARVPSLGYSFANKIRFEDQELVSDLSHTVRATKKAFDRAPIDSPRLGLFFSLNKEINLDIVRSFGDFKIDNFIGTPFDRYEYEYTDLKSIREYYFERITRNFQEYIQLVRYIDKSLFDTLESLVPARARISKGLLIEPHILERAKVRWNRPESDRNDYETSIDFMETTDINFDYGVYEGVIEYEDINELSGRYEVYEGLIDEYEEISIISDYQVLNGLINYDDTTILNGNTPFYTASITFDLGVRLDALNITQDLSDFTQIGDSLSEGFGLYGSASHAKVTTLDSLGNLTSSRKQVYKITENYTEKIYTQTEGWPATTNNEGVKYEYVDVEKQRSFISILPFGSDAPIANNDEVVEYVTESLATAQTASWLDNNDTETGSANIVDFTFPVRLHGSEILGDYLYLIGGYDGTNWNQDYYKLNLISGSSWETDGSIPTTKGHGRAGAYASYIDRIWHQSRAPDNDYVIYEYVTGSASAKQIIDLGNNGSGLYPGIVINPKDELLYFGGGRPGLSTRSGFRSVELSNTSGSITVLSDLPQDRENHGFIYIPVSLSTYTSGSILLIGGKDNSGNNYDSIYEYDIENDTWSGLLHTLPSALNQVDSVLYSGSVYIYGVNSGEGKFYKYDYSANTSEVLNVRESGSLDISQAPISLYDGIIYSVAGYTSDDATYQSKTDAWIIEDTREPGIEEITTSVSSSIISVEPLDGYFSTHYKNVANLSEGLERSFFKGSTQTADTTPDGLPPVQTFTTNPNILRVADAGRGSGEPILEVT